MGKYLGLTEVLEEQLRALPAKPGVYLFPDDGGAVLYVGKATSLRQRVRSYFGTPFTLVPKLQKMVARVQDLDFIVTDSEHEAVILECNLIKEHRPPYNVRLKDDKSYPYIKVSLNEEWPRVFVTRRFEDDGGRYFGPFANAGSVRKTLDLLKKLFRYCSPRSPITGKKPRPCFDYYIQRCVGACSGEITREEYSEVIRRVIFFLEGRQEQVVRDLRRKMAQAAEAVQFERAASFRDQIQAVEKVTEGLKMAITARGDEDVIAFARDNDEACVQIFFVRRGKLIGRENFILEGTQDEEPGQVMASFVQQFYGSAPYIPPRILLQTSLEDMPVILSWLEGKRGGRVSLEVPQRGQKKKLVDMVAENADQALEQLKIKRLADSGKIAVALKELEDVLHLTGLPRRVECYDISDIRGTSAVGSMVVFEEGRPRNSAYRRFKIRTVEGVDDYAMMQEVLRRRFKRVKAQDDGSSWAVLPDLVLIDGGRGHLTSVMEVMRELEVELPLAALAKENEEVFLPGVAKPVILPRTSQALYLLQRIRDEAHRFALSYHLKVRKKAAFASALAIPGIGPRRRRALLRKFGSVQGVKKASVEELAAVPGMTGALARRVKEYL